MSRFRLILSLLLVAATAAGAASRGQGYGPGAHATIDVRDRATQEPLVGATVTVICGADTLRGATAKSRSGRSAEFACDRIFRDSVTLEVRYVGYRTFSRRYGAAGFSGYIDVGMETDAQQIARVIVLGEQVAMVFRGDTTIYNAAAFRTLADDRLEELLRQLPGVEVRDKRIYADGREVRRIYVDGRNLFGRQTEAALTDLRADDVLRVRIYEEPNPVAKHTGNDTAPKEKVMDVETRSKRAVVRGGELSAMVGASLEKDYSGHSEVRHAEAMRLYRHSEQGSWQAEARNSKDESAPGRIAQSARITPAKRTSAELSHEYRRGDTTSVWNYARFDRGRSSSEGRSLTEYFPTDAYTLFDSENRSESASTARSFSYSNMTMLLRGRHTFEVRAGVNLGYSDSRSRSRTQQRIDRTQTLTQMHTTDDQRNLGLLAAFDYSLRLSDRSRMSFRCGVGYTDGTNAGRQVDTLASAPGLRTRLHDDGRYRHFDIDAGAGYHLRAGRHASLSVQYCFTCRQGRTERLAVDYLNDPQGLLDTVNTYDYATDCRTHGLTLSWVRDKERLRCQAGLTASLYDIAREEHFPTRERARRQFFALAPDLSLTWSGTRRSVDVGLTASPAVPSVEELRQTLDATDPLRLTAGNPDLKLPTLYSFRVRFSDTDPVSARSLWIGLRGEYGINHIATRRRLFLEETYLPRWDYTAQAGAQLLTQENVGGRCGISADAGYSQRVTALRSTLRASVGYSFQQVPYCFDTETDRSRSHALGLTAGFESGFSTKVRIACSSRTSMRSYTTQHTTRRELREVVNARLDLRLGRYFGSAGVCYEFYCNSTAKALTQHNTVLNLAAGRKFGRENRFSLALGVIDLLNSPDYASTRFHTDYVLTTVTSYLGRYAYIEAGYTF